MNHLGRVLGILLLFLVGLAATSFGQRGVTVYEDRDFRGRSQEYGVGRYLNPNGGLGNLRNDKASSVVVQRGFRARLCEDEGDRGLGSGRCEEYGEGSFNLRYNDTASFIEVVRGGGFGGPAVDPDRSNDRVTIYSALNQRGVTQTFGDGIYRFIDGNFGRLANDSASSIYVPTGYRVKLCENEGRGPYGERCEEFGAGDHNLRFQNAASSVEVRRGGSGWQLGANNGGGGQGNERGAIVYVDSDQRGASQLFEIGTFRADHGQLGSVGNDRASSVWVANGYRVQLCENEPRDFGNAGSGRCEEYGPGRWNLRYADTASYVRVWRSR